MTRRIFFPGRLVAAVVAVTAGVGTSVIGQGTGPAATLPSDTASVVHVLNRLGYGPRPGDIERVRRMGLDAYIEQQLHPGRIADVAVDRRLAAFPTIHLSTAELARDYFGPAEALRRAQQQAAARQTQDPPARQTPSPEQQAARQREQQVLQELAQARVLRAVLSERQLEEVLVDFWFNHFNVFSGKAQARAYLTEYERDVIRPHVLGNFRDMLGAVAESPAMLAYLDNFQNVDPNAAQRLQQRMPQRAQQPLPQQRARGLNENYARELMELHTLGVDGGYTQDDVVAVARAFTGWGIDRPREGGAFRFTPMLHDNAPKVVLGTRITAGGKKDGEAVLDLLASHPATAQFIATKLARRFVADDPPAALVARVAQVFLASKGDLRQVTRAIVTSPEFFAPDARQAKVKTPLEFVVSAVRVSGATLMTPAPLVQALRTLGMPLYGAQAPTGWGDTAADWVNTGALLNRLNFAIQLANGQLRGARLTVRTLAPQAGTDISTATIDAVVARLIGGDVSPMTRETLVKAESPQHLVALTLGSPEFQKR